MYYSVYNFFDLQITSSNLELQKIERELRDELASMYSSFQFDAQQNKTREIKIISICILHSWPYKISNTPYIISFFTAKNLIYNLEHTKLII